MELQTCFGGFPNPNWKRLLRGGLYVDDRVKLVFLDKTQIRGFWITFCGYEVQERQTCGPERVSRNWFIGSKTATHPSLCERPVTASTGTGLVDVKLLRMEAGIALHQNSLASHLFHLLQPF